MSLKFQAALYSSSRSIVNFASNNSGVKLRPGRIPLETRKSQSEIYFGS